MEGLTIVRNRWARFAGSGTMAAGLMAALCLVLLPGCPSGMTDACANDPCDDGDNCTVDTCAADDTTSVGFTCTNEPVDCMDNGVCNPADGECVDCVDDADCDNGDFCDGSETCDATNMCVAGTAPCDEAAGEVCLEDTDTCGVGCVDDADCTDDGLFCTGTAVCDTDTGACAESGSPCAAGEVCDESNDACVECLVDEDCGDNETCNTNSFTCEGGAVTMCNSNGDCPDDGVFCNGTEFCNTTGAEGACESTGDPCAANQTCNEVANTCDAIAGMTFTLTAETDTFVGTVNADTFDAPANTLGDNDILDGAGGPDTLNATLLGVDLTAGAEIPTIVDVETWNIESRAAANIFQYQGEQATLVNLSGTADFFWDSYDASQATSIVLNGYGEELELDFDGDLTDSDDSVSITADDVGVGTVTVNLSDGGGGDLETLTLSSTGGPNKVDLFIDGSVNVDDWVLAGDADLTLEVGSDDIDGEDVDASSLGFLNLRVDVDPGSSVDLTGFDGGPDVLTLFDSDTPGGDSADVDADEGVDIVVETSLNDLTVLVTNAGAAGQNNNSQAFELSGDDPVDVDDITVDDVENVSIASNTTDEDDPTAVVNTIDDLFADELEVLTITGDTDLTFGDTLGQTAAVESLVATSFSGDLTASFDGQGDTVLIASGSGDDDLGGSDMNDVIEGGDGDDRITGFAGDDELTGGDGDNTFVYVSAFGAAPSDDDDEDVITDFDAGDEIELDASNAFADGTGDLTNNGACTDNSIDIDNDGTDTTILIDLDTDAVDMTCITIVLEDVVFDDTDFTFDAGNDVLSLQ